MTHWLLDLGNTRLKLAAWSPGEGLSAEPLALPHREPAYASALAGWLRGTQSGQTAWLASVAPVAIAAELRLALESAGLRVRPVHVRARTGTLHVGYAEPSRLGVDRYLALLGASLRGPGPWLVVSVGSAMTVDLLDASGRHHGGLVAPSPGHMREALAARFPALPAAGGEPRAFATDTADGVASGCLAAAQGLVERSFREAKSRLGVVPAVLMTGGGAGPVAAGLPFATEAAPTLVLEGLAAHASRVLEEES